MKHPMPFSRLLAVLLCLALPSASRADVPVPPSRPGVDAPELAALGPQAVGVRTLTLVQPGRARLGGWDPAAGPVPRAARALAVDVWYPAREGRGEAETYRASLDAEPPQPPAHFSVPGIAHRDAPAAAGRHPLVVVAHGYGNVTAGYTWLGENLASKGYVVAAIRHEDPPIADRSAFPQVLLDRPLDTAFVARTLREQLAGEGLVEPSRLALLGYSMGGYGVLTAGGAPIEPQSPLAALVPGGVVLPYARGGAEQGAMHVEGVRAIVAISPAGGSLGAWGKEGLAALRAPLLLISGDRDHTVDHASGAKAFFEAATNAPRYLLTYLGGGHALGMGPAPREMRDSLWNLDWFEDPVWRKERIIAINLHFVTAFLDRHLKDDASRDAYLAVAVERSSEGQWPNPEKSAYSAFSPAEAPITVWKGFHRRHAEGLQLQYRAAGGG